MPQIYTYPDKPTKTKTKTRRCIAVRPISAKRPYHPAPSLYSIIPRARVLMRAQFYLV
jgi:hypothetical protein